MTTVFRLAAAVLLLHLGVASSLADAPAKAETLPEITARLARETEAAYNACRFSALSKDYFSRFSRDPRAMPSPGEIAIQADWQIVVPPDTDPLANVMAEQLQTFLRQCMNLELPIVRQAAAQTTNGETPTIVLLDSGGGDSEKPESFTIRVEPGRVTVHGDSPNGLRDGIVRLVDRIGLREAPILAVGETTYAPLLRLRVGAVPAGGSYKDAVFFGYNAVLFGGGDLFALSRSDAIPELSARRVPDTLEANREGMKELGKFGLKAYAWLNTRQKFSKDDPVLLAHPEIRGSLTWSADGEYNLCTSHPLVRRYLKETVRGMFETLPELQGVVLIVGGEGFYHCHMRPFGVAKGHTNCARCEPLGAEAAVADLCNDLASAAREVNPNAEVVVWPYSAEHVWASDAAATGFLQRLKPGVALLTEVEKSEIITKRPGLQKSIWDYSIDFIGPAARTRQQIDVCAAHDIPVYLKSEPELAFEAPRLPQIPCMDRWADRSETLASCGAEGAWVFPAFRPFFGTSTAEINKLLWWTPMEDRESQLQSLARRIAGASAADALRTAWKETSAAVAQSPELPSYYLGPYYLGPMHPICANRQQPLPDVFYGQYLFRAEHMDSIGLKREPTVIVDPAGDRQLFGDCYAKMDEHLTRAAEAIRSVSPRIDKRHRLAFDAEAWPTLWFHHTARTHSNFYKSCALRDSLTALLGKPSLTDAEHADAVAKLAEWKRILEDERRNTKESLPLIESDMRLDPYFGGDHTFSHGARMIEAKLKLLDEEIGTYLPSLESQLKKSAH
jgi:hypothetical protein